MIPNHIRINTISVTDICDRCNKSFGSFHTYSDEIFLGKNIRQVYCCGYQIHGSDITQKEGLFRGNIVAWNLSTAQLYEVATKLQTSIKQLIHSLRKDLL